jgi:hypothetical protein
MQSTSLAARVTTPINPRAFIFTPPNGTGGVNLRSPLPLKPLDHFSIVSFARGEQLIELAAIDKRSSGDGALRFYLIRYKQACNSSPNGCSYADLFTPSVESGFTELSLYEDTDVANRTVDCTHCHQPAGPGTPKHLLMRELQYPWKHWVSTASDNDRGTLLHAFQAAHAATEDYASIPGGIINKSGAHHLQGLIENNFGYNDQPFEFDANKINTEITQTHPGLTPPQILRNDPPNTSATWQAMFDLAKNGQGLAPPYMDFTPAELVTKLPAATNAYTAVMAGTMARNKLPDISDVLLDAALPLLMFVPTPGLTGREILVEVCHDCHNSKVDPSLSRAQFNVETLDTLSRSIKDLAIARIHLPQSDAHHMPPHRFRDLSQANIDAVTQELMK